MFRRFDSRVTIMARGGRALGRLGNTIVQATRRHLLCKIASNAWYQLIRQPKPIVERLFEIEFLDAGAEAFAFAFG